MNSQRITQLDGIRFIAVSMIFIAHWIQGSISNDVFSEIPFIHGVTLFFVLSGYLITKSLLENKATSTIKVIKTFYIRRFLRIFPIYYLLLALLFFLDYESTRTLFPWLISYTTNIYQSIENIEIGHLNHLWSLAVEEQFYLFWPFILLFSSIKNSVRVILFTIVLSILVKTYLFFYVGNWMATSYFTLSCMHALGLGALLAYLVLFKKNSIKKLSNPKWIYFISAIYIILLVVQIRFGIQWYREIFNEFIFALLSFLIVLKAATTGFTGALKLLLEFKPLTYLGEISYGLYLYHLFIPSLYTYLSFKLGLTIGNKPLLFLVYFLLTVVIAHISWKLIETPINRLKNKVTYS